MSPSEFDSVKRHVRELEKAVAFLELRLAEEKRLVAALEDVIKMTAGLRGGT